MRGAIPKALRGTPTSLLSTSTQQSSNGVIHGELNELSLSTSTFADEMLEMAMPLVLGVWTLSLLIALAAMLLCSCRRYDTRKVELHKCRTHQSQGVIPEGFTEPHGRWNNVLAPPLEKK